MQNSFSYWEKKAFFTDIDIVVIGSGIVGLNAALHLKSKNPSLNVCVIERGALPSGASSRNAGFACFGSSSELLDDLTKMSEEKVFGLVEKRYRGLQRLRKLHGDKSLGYKNLGGYELFDNEELFEKCAEKLEYLNNMVGKAIGASKTYKIVPKRIKRFGFSGFSQLIVNQHEGQIDTGKMIISLIGKAVKKGIRIINGLEVAGFQDLQNRVEVQLKGGFSFSCKKLLVCTNGFARQLLPDQNVLPARAQVLVTSEIKGLKVKGTFNYDRGYYYFRNIDNRILFGGGRNLDFKAEETTEFGLTTKVQDSLEQKLREQILPGAEYTIEHRWSGIMGVGPEKTTIIRTISPNVFCGVRMGGMGVAIGTIVGEEVADLCLDSY